MSDWTWLLHALAAAFGGVLGLVLLDALHAWLRAEEDDEKHVRERTGRG